MTHNNLYANYCFQRQKENLFRALPSYPKRRLIDFSSNDFLNLSRNPQLINAAFKYAKKYGVGATGSRLLSGNKRCFSSLEKQIAKDKKTQNALLFNSGYQANSTVLSSLLDQKILKNQALVFFDKANHSSLYHGIFLSQSQLIRYHHLNMQDLEKKLQKHEKDQRPKFIVSETLFSMDGDMADIATLIKLAKKYSALLYLDEAYTTGIFGENGYGLSTLHDFQDVPHVIMGTLSKAIGASGAFVACNNDTHSYLINNCNGFIYSTAPSPMIIGAIHAAWKLLPKLNKQREKILEHANNLKTELRNMHFDIGSSTSHIIPIILKDEKKVIDTQNYLKTKGLLLSAIRPPTVPVNTARLRIAITSSHTQNDTDKLLKALKKIC